MRDDVKNACIEKTHTEPETLRGTVILCLAIMIMRENAENPDSELCPFFKLAPFRSTAFRQPE